MAPIVYSTRGEISTGRDFGIVRRPHVRSSKKGRGGGEGETGSPMSILRETGETGETGMEGKGKRPANPARPSYCAWVGVGRYMTPPIPYPTASERGRPDRAPGAKRNIPESGNGGRIHRLSNPSQQAQLNPWIALGPAVHAQRQRQPLHLSHPPRIHPHQTVTVLSRVGSVQFTGRRHSVSADTRMYTPGTHVHTHPTHALSHTVQRQHLPLRILYSLEYLHLLPNHTCSAGIAPFSASKLLFLGCSWRALPYHTTTTSSSVSVCATLTDPPRSFPIPGVDSHRQLEKKARPPSSPTRDLSFI